MPQVDDEDDPAGGRTYGLGRVLALSDAVFAIALTLLVLSLQDDIDVAPEKLGEALGDAVPELFAYAVSVAVIGTFWIGHHGFWARVRRVDIGMLWLNLLYLGLIALVPFPTDLLGRYDDQAPAVALYAAVMVLVGLAHLAATEHAFRRGLVDPLAPPRRLATLPMVVVFGASIPVAWLSTTAAQLTWLLLIPASRLQARSTGADG
jgi:uncharacterized membrane protein